VLTLEQIKERFAQINNISKEEAEEKLSSAKDADEALEIIKQFNLQKYREQHPLNRKQRRALAKKKKNNAESIQQAVEKLGYINLIEKFRALNEKREKEDNEENDKDE